MNQKVRSGSAEKIMDANQAGVTLMETMIAIVVLSVTLLGLVQALPLSIRMNTNARVGVSTLSVAQANVEDLKTVASSNIANFDGMSNGSAKYTTDGVATTDTTNAAYTVTWTIANGGLTDSAGNVLSKIITVQAKSLKAEYGTGPDVTLTSEVVRPPS